MLQSPQKRRMHSIPVNNAKLWLSFLSIFCANSYHKHYYAQAFNIAPLQISSTTSIKRYQSHLCSSKREPQLQMEIPITATIKKKKNTRRKISNRRLETTENLLEEKQVKKVAKRVRRPRAASNTNKSEFLSKEMLNHEILTKQQENEIGESMAKARKLRTRISKYMIDKNVFESQKQLERVAKPKKKSPKTRNSIYLKDRKRKKGENAFFENEFDLADYELENDFQFEIDFDSMHEIAEVENAKDSNGFHDVNHVDESIFSIHFDPLLKQDIHNLSEHDIVHGLSIPGGKTELIQILSDGINARRKLISCNIKLVTSIARSWMRRAIGSSNASSASAGNTLQLVQIYQVGSWDLPSLDDVVNEGIIGLTKAADKYEAKRGNKFSTYATHWITNYVRECFRDASTGSLRIPSALHQVKADHGKIVKRCYDLGLPPPSEEDIAKEIGVNVKRLRTALRTTQGLVSIDASLYSGMQNTKGSGAGGDGTDSNLVLADTLRW